MLGEEQSMMTKSNGVCAGIVLYKGLHSFNHKEDQIVKQEESL